MPARTEKSTGQKTTAAVFAALLLALVVAASTNTATAQNADPWVTEAVPTAGLTPNAGSVRPAYNGETIAIAYTLSTGRVAFALRDPVTGWALQTQDVTGVTTKGNLGDLVGMGGTTWALVTGTGTASQWELFKSTDNGATWASTTSGKDWGSASLSFAPGKLGVSFHCSSGSPCNGAAGEGFMYSDDGGTTWTGSTVINDNSGSPATCGSPTRVNIESTDIVANSAGPGFSVLMRESVSPWRIFSVATSDYYFWSTPYVSHCSTTLRTAVTDPPAHQTTCSGLSPTAAGSSVRIVNSGFGGAVWTAAGKTFYCQNGLAVPSAAPTNSLTFANVPSDCNLAGCIITGTDTVAGKQYVYLFQGALSTTVYTINGATASSAQSSAVAVTSTKAHVIYQDGTTGQIRNAYSDLYPTTTPALSVAVTGLSGFSVDPTGNTIVARTGGSVSTYSGGTLTFIADDDTFCQPRPDGVFATATNVLFIKCYEDDEASTEFYSIRSASLTTPTKNSPSCFDADFCIEDIPDAALVSGALAGNHDDDVELVGFEDFPITYGNNNDGVLDEDHVWMAFAFSTTAADVGVVTYVMRNNGIDQSDIATANIGGGQQPDQICVVRDLHGATAGKSFLYAASHASNVRGYRVDFELGGVLTSNSKLIPSLVNVFPGTSTTAGARGIACGEGKFAILNDHKVTVWNRGSSSPYLTKTVGLTAVAEAGGIAMSADGGWVAYVADGNKVQFFNTTTGNYTAPIDRAAGNFQGIALQGHGCAVWDATQTVIERYDLIGITCDEDQAYFDPESGQDGGVRDADGDGNPDSGTGTSGPGSGNNGGNGGIVDTGSALGGLIGSGAVVLAAIVVGYALTANKRRRREEE